MCGDAPSHLYITQLLKLEPLMPLPIVAIIGRPNVGKSTIVNRLAGDQRLYMMNQ